MGTDLLTFTTGVQHRNKVNLTIHHLILKYFIQKKILVIDTATNAVVKLQFTVKKKVSYGIFLSKCSFE